jgi:uracil-DNA glycosylase
VAPGGSSIGAVATTDERRERLTEVLLRARGCERCPALVATRTQVVFGTGAADADVMFVGEAPGREEDRQGTPLAGRSGELLAGLLEEVGLARDDVFVTSVVKCRPPDNRNPVPAEVAHCREYLEAQLDLVRPKVVCTLGNFATKLLRDGPEGITALRGTPEVVQIGGRRVRLLPLLHPAAALYTPANVELLRRDVAQLPALLAQPEPAQPAPEPDPAPSPPDATPEAGSGASGPPAQGKSHPEPEPEESPAEPDQLGLF